MKLRSILLIYFLCFYMAFSLAQVPRLKYLGVETGMNFIESEMSNMDDYIRGDVPSYSLGYSSSSLTTLTSRSFAGIKYEIFSLNDQISLSGGLRYSRINSSVGKKRYWGSSTNYFYWLYLQDGVNTEYLKVKEIDQKSDYIGIPVEIRFFPARRPRIFRFYFKLGAEINCLIQSQKDIVFYDEAMNPYKNELTAKVANPKPFYAAAYVGGGFRFGKELKPSVSIEASMPYLLITQNSAGLVNPIYGGGFQINVQIPIKSKVK